MSKNSAALSVKQSETVRGYEVKRLALGAYLRAIEAVREASQTLMAACFPGMDAAQVLGSLKTMDVRMLTALMLRAMDAAPAEAVRLLSVLTGVEERALLDDPAIGLDGAAEMIEAFWRINGVGNFMQAAGRMAAQIRDLRAKTGSSV